MDITSYITDLKTNWAPEDLTIHLDNFRLAEGNAYVKLTVTKHNIYLDDEPDIQEVSILVSQCKMFSWRRDTFHAIEIQDNHPILWPFTDNMAALYFSSAAPDGNRLYYEIVETHELLLEGLLPVNRFLNHVYGKQIVFAPFGLFAKGPEKLMQAYAACLESAGMKHVISEIYVPVREERRPQVLILGDSFIVGETFELE